jgi:hypothetical protein
MFELHQNFFPFLKKSLLDGRPVLLSMLKKPTKKEAFQLI